MWTKPALSSRSFGPRITVGASGDSDNKSMSTATIVLSAGAAAIGIGAYLYFSESPEDIMKRTYSK